MVVDGDNDDGDHHPHRHQGVAWSLEKIEVYEVRKTKKIFVFIMIALVLRNPTQSQFHPTYNIHISQEGWETKQKFTNGKFNLKYSKI